MPVHGLWELLRGNGLIRRVNDAGAVRELLEGKKVAVDLSFWAVEAGTMAHQLHSTGRHTWPHFFLLVSFWRALHFLRVGCSPIGVADGPHAPSLKCRQRRANGQFIQALRQILELFRALGCPTYEADGEAEGLCAYLSQRGVVDLVASSDSDVFPFGAEGVILKCTNLASSDSAWNLEVADVAAVHNRLSLGKQGLICLATLAGCDFSEGVEHVGAEKGLLCVHGLLKHCENGCEESLRPTFVRMLNGDVPAELVRLAELNGCQTCRRCGHGSRKAQHGAKGCDLCGTSEGCTPRTGACPCDVHSRTDEVTLARVLRRNSTLPSSAQTQLVWSTYENAATQAIAGSEPIWKRPNVQAVIDLLDRTCSYPEENVLRCLLPTLLLWDFQHPEDSACCFVPTAVVSECFAGLAKDERRASSPQSLAVLDWRVKPGSRHGAALSEALESLPNARRAVPKALVLRLRPDLVADHCVATLRKRAEAAAVPRRNKNREHWISQAEQLCHSWGFRQVPDVVQGLVDQLEMSWRREVLDLCTSGRVGKAKDPWSEAQKIVTSFGLPYDLFMTEALKPILMVRQTTLDAFLQPPSGRDVPSPKTPTSANVDVHPTDEPRTPRKRRTRSPMAAETPIKNRRRDSRISAATSAKPSLAASIPSHGVLDGCNHPLPADYNEARGGVDTTPRPRWRRNVLS